jgi:hypothetical protein
MWISETTTDSPGFIRGMASGARTPETGVAMGVGLLDVHGVAVAIGAAVESLVGVGVLGSQRVAVGAIDLGEEVGSKLESPGFGVAVAAGSEAAPAQALSHRHAANSPRATCSGMEL